jgi:hypothetical protein
MPRHLEAGVIVLASILAASASPSWAQQKGQYVPGRFGPSVGVLPGEG